MKKKDKQVEPNETPETGKPEQDLSQGLGEETMDQQETEPTPDEASPDEQVREWQDKYLRLSAEFDNYRKRTLKEKMDLVRHGGEDVLVKLLPVVDDMERAIQAVEKTGDLAALKEGLDLIFKKFGEFFSSQGVKVMDDLHQEFDTDRHEALTKIPAPTEDLKGKVVDVIQKGYTLHDKVIRYSRVVVGE